MSTPTMFAPKKARAHVEVLNDGIVANEAPHIVDLLAIDATASTTYPELRCSVLDRH
jgi:hypothetical protein